MLSRYRRAIAGTAARSLAGPTAIAAFGYFFVWTLLGAGAYAAGLASASAVMRWPALARLFPLASGLALLVAGSLQFTRWKLRQLRHCRDTPCCGAAAADEGAWGHGLHLGLHCRLCCCGFMLLLLVTDVMDVRVMAAVAAAITVERLAPAPERVARVLGVALIGAGVVLMVRTLSGA